MEECPKFNTYLLEAMKLQKLAVRVLNETLAPMQLSALQAVYMIYLHSNNQGLTLKELTDYTYVDKAQITRVSADLISRGLIVTDKSEGKERRYRVFLTEAGRLKAGEILSEMPAVENEILEKLDAGSRQNLCEAMQYLTEILSSHEK